MGVLCSTRGRSGMNTKLSPTACKNGMIWDVQGYMKKRIPVAACGRSGKEWACKFMSLRIWVLHGVCVSLVTDS